MLHRALQIVVVAVVMAVAVPLSLSCAPAAQGSREFTLPTAAGGQYSLAAQKGHRVVISFYAGYY